MKKNFVFKIFIVVVITVVISMIVEAILVKYVPWCAEHKSIITRIFSYIVGGVSGACGVYIASKKANKKD